MAADHKQRNRPNPMRGLVAVHIHTTFQQGSLRIHHPTPIARTNKALKLRLYFQTLSQYPWHPWPLLRHSRRYCVPCLNCPDCLMMDLVGGLAVCQPASVAGTPPPPPPPPPPHLCIPWCRSRSCVASRKDHQVTTCRPRPSTVGFMDLQSDTSQVHPFDPMVPSLYVVVCLTIHDAAGSLTSTQQVTTSERPLQGCYHRTVLGLGGKVGR